MLENVGDVLCVQWPVLVGEPDPAVELGVAGELPVEPGHADQDQAHVAAVEKVRPPQSKPWSSDRGLSLGVSHNPDDQPQKDDDAEDARQRLFLPAVSTLPCETATSDTR